MAVGELVRQGAGLGADVGTVVDRAECAQGALIRRLGISSHTVQGTSARPHRLLTPGIEATRTAPIVGIQTEYSLVERTADRELLPMAEALGLGATLWSPLGGGLLTGKYRRGTDGRLTDLGGVIHTESTAQKTSVVDEVLAISAEVERPAAQVAMAWVNEQSARRQTPTVPVIGPRNVAQLDDYLEALTLELSPEQFARLSAASAPELGVPHEGNLANLPRLQGGDATILPPAHPRRLRRGRAGPGGDYPRIRGHSATAPGRNPWHPHPPPSVAASATSRRS